MSHARTWITGARGFLGRHLSRELTAAGIRCAGVGHGRAELAADEPALEVWLNGDVSLSNLDHLRNMTTAPEVIYHLAGGAAVGASLAAPLEDFTRTVAGMAELLEWIRTRSPETRLVHVSTAAVYGSAASETSGEHALRPLSPYGTHKLMVEQMLRGYGVCFGIRAAIVRFFSLYGEGLTKQLFFDLSQRLSQHPAELRLGGSGDELRDWLHVADACRQLRGAAERCGTDCPTFDGGTGQATSVRQAVTYLCQSWDQHPTVIFNGQARAGDPPRLVADRLRMGDLAAPPWLPLDEGLRRYVAWYRRQSGGA